MKKSFCIIALLALTCTLFTGCKKEDGGPDSKEDLSYLLMTYRCFSSNNHVYKDVWTYEGYKVMGHKSYVDGLLTFEYKNYSYDGLNASWDGYSYQNNEVAYYTHYETEYLDETFQRIKYQQASVYYDDPQNNYTSEVYREFDGKRCIGVKSYKNGILVSESHDVNYDGLHCTSITTKYNPYPNVVKVENSFNTVFLDDTYFRTKSRTRTSESFYEDGTSTISTRYEIYDYDCKKPIGSQTYVNGKLSTAYRDYQYDGLTCTYFIDNYNYLNGEVVSTQMYEVEYLE